MHSQLMPPVAAVCLRASLRLYNVIVVQARYGFLYRAYRPGCWGYEIVFILVRSLAAGVFAWLDHGRARDEKQLAGVAMVLVISTVFHVFIQPFRQVSPPPHSVNQLPVESRYRRSHRGIRLTCDGLRCWRRTVLRVPMNTVLNMFSLQILACFMASLASSPTDVPGNVALMDQMVRYLVIAYRVLFLGAVFVVLIPQLIGDLTFSCCRSSCRDSSRGSRWWNLRCCCFRAAKATAHHHRRQVPLNLIDGQGTRPSILCEAQ